MYVKRFESRFLATNTYLIACEVSGEAAVIDPNGRLEEILDLIGERGFRLKYIINTHGHLDHIWHNARLKEATDASILIHEADAPMLDRNRWYLFPMTGRFRVSPPADTLLREGDVVEIGLIRLEVIHTPGHSPGGISLRYKKHLFTGDVLFAGAVGRVNLKGGSLTRLLESIKDKLLILSDDITVHPGHGPETSVGTERMYNPFLKVDRETLEKLMLPRRKRTRAGRKDEGSSSKNESRA